MLIALGPRQDKSDCVPLPWKHCCAGNLPCDIHSNVSGSLINYLSLALVLTNS